MNQNSNPDSENQAINTQPQIQQLEKRSGYGMALLIIVSALILISTLLYGVMGLDESTPILIVNGLLIIIHMVLVFISKTDKLKAYSGGLLVFLVCLAVNWILTGRALIGGLLLSGGIIICYVFFIYEAYCLKKLDK